jgi:hypothetical protein
MLTVDPMAYARSRQAELTRAAGGVRLAQMAPARPRRFVGTRHPMLRWLASHLRLKPAASAACCC